MIGRVNEMKIKNLTVQLSGQNQGGWREIWRLGHRSQRGESTAVNDTFSVNATEMMWIGVGY